VALLSGICNGLFTAPMRVIPRWRWENIWLVFIVTSCIAAPVLAVQTTAPGFLNILSAAPVRAVSCAVGFGFAWGFGAILFGLSVARLGVSVANTLVIGLSSALGSLVPLAMEGRFGYGPQQVLLYGGVLAFVLGVWICGKAARLRDAKAPLETKSASTAGYFFAVGAGIMSAVFNMGYTLALPIASAGTQLGYSSFASAKCIGAATPMLGEREPSIGWPLSLSMDLVTSNLIGFLLREWRAASRRAVHVMALGLSILLVAIVLCAFPSKAGET
jgi:L-rhamnose-H+ transport protein